MKVCHTISSLEGGYGVSAALHPLLLRQADLGVEVCVMSLDSIEQSNLTTFTDLRFRPDYTSFPLSKLGRSKALKHALRTYTADLYHTHGMWMMANVYPSAMAHRLCRPFVLSPHGMLAKEALAFSSWKKRLFWSAWQESAMAKVSCFHATAESEYNDIRMYGLNQPVAIIPHGVDLPEFPAVEKRQQRSPPFIVSLGRMHPVKGLDRLISAFAAVAREFPDWQLRIIGPDECGYANILKEQVSALGLERRVVLQYALFGASKWQVLREASVFALPTLRENFGMTVAESLAAETPVISTKGAPWAGLVENRCGWWIEHGPDALAATLRAAMAMTPAQRRAMGARGREWMRRDFGWEAIGRQMLDVYSWLIKGTDVPSSVRLK